MSFKKRPEIKECCITCTHHNGDFLACTVDEKPVHISYMASFNHKCKRYKVSEDYKKGGKYFWDGSWK